jgi:hypothetical protein
MIKTLTQACLIAVANSIKLEAEAEAEKFRALNDYTAFSTTTAAGNAIRASGVQWSDPDFPAGNESLGDVEGDSAKGAAGAQNATVNWKRLSEIYGSDTKLFANKEIFSSA